MWINAYIKKFIPYSILRHTCSYRNKNDKLITDNRLK